MEKQESTEQKQIKKTIYISAFAFVFILSLVGAGNWYFSTYIFNEDRPPELISSGEKLQGEFIDETFGFLEYVNEDKYRFERYQISDLLKGDAGVNFFLARADIAYDEIVERAIEPKKGLKILIAYYNYETSEFNEQDCFLVYPISPFSNTCPIPYDRISNVVIPRNNGFVIISNQEFNYNSALILSSKNSSSPYKLTFKPDEEGWSLRPLTTGFDDHPQIERIWLQTGQNKFEETENFSNIDLSGEYKMAWIKFKKNPEIIYDPYISR